MKVLAHPDPFVLEHELLEAVARGQREDPLAAVLVVVPTQRLADHVQRRLAEHSGARLAVHVLQYRALAFRILQERSRGRPRILTRRLREWLLESALENVSDNPWREFVERRPGARGGLLRALDDLREGGITPAEASEVLDRGARERGLAEIYAAYVTELENKGRAGFADDAGFVVAATRDAAAFARRSGFRAVIHHGAYELIGVHLRLLREIDREAPVTFLLAAEPGAPASRYAERFARRHLLPGDGNLERLPDHEGGLLGPRLAALYDEDSAPAPLDPDTVPCRNAQGAVPEMTLAVRYALCWIAGETPAEEVAVVARGLAPYGAAIESMIEDGIPLSTSARAPLRRDPAVHDLLVLLRTVADGFPRGATVEVLRSPRIRWDALGEQSPYGDRAEGWSREAKLLKGLEGWTRDLPDWAAETYIPAHATEEERERRREQGRWRQEQAAAMGRALARLQAAVEPDRARSWSEHAERLEWLVRNVLPGCGEDESSPAVRTLLELLADLTDLDDLSERVAAVPFGEMVQWLTRAVDETELPVEGSSSGGLRILDVMQARGLTFRRVLVVGMNERFFPRIPREDPFLSDDARRRLMEHAGTPLAVKSEGDDEEHLLLSMTLGSARDGVEISWQRADDDGKSKTPSLALREIARLIYGAPDLGKLTDQAKRVSAHPESWLESLSHDPGLLSASEERVLIALRSAGPDVASQVLGPREGRLARGLEMLRNTESFEPGARDYDARIGRAAPVPDRLSVSALESLGRCPLQYFLGHVLRVDELEEEATLFGIDAREMGLHVHRALEILYGRLQKEGVLDDPGKASGRARELLPEAWREATRTIDRRLSKHLGFFWRWYGQHWIDSLQTFVADDLERTARDGWSVAELERYELRRLAFGKGVEATVSGRFDRVLEKADAALIGDYKSSGKPKDRTNITNMLKGSTLQVPLYWLLNDERAAIELLGVGPEFPPSRREDERRSRFSGFENANQREGFLETMRVLLSLVSSGNYPLSPNHHCSWCAYAQACRHNHAPTLERESNAADASDFRKLGRKNKTKLPTLDLVPDSSEGRST